MQEPDETPEGQLAIAMLREMEAEAQTKPTPLRFSMEVRAAVLTYVKDHPLNINHLIPIACAAQYPRHDEFIEIVKRLYVDPDSFDWPIEDPLRCVALAFHQTLIDRLHEKGFTLNWDGLDPADWWKEEE
jgi:hypothetical protein